MANPTTPAVEPSSTASRATPASTGNDFESLLTDRSNGIRIKGLVLAVEHPKEIKGVSKGGNNYCFLTREMQIFTGNKAVACKDQRDPDKAFPEIRVGQIVEFKIKSVRMNGLVPSFELDTE